VKKNRKGLPVKRQKLRSHGNSLGKKRSRKNQIGKKKEHSGGFWGKFLKESGSGDFGTQKKKKWKTYLERGGIHNKRKKRLLENTEVTKGGVTGSPQGRGGISWYMQKVPSRGVLTTKRIDFREYRK